MNGTSATTGKSLADIDHLRQSVTDILTTRKGTRVMRRDYGSDLPELIDAPMNRQTLMEIYAATVGALTLWEPRIQVSQVSTSSASPGSIVLDMDGIYLPTGQQVSLSGIKVS